MDIASQILSNMPNNLTDLEKARYIYLELCKILSFTTKLNNADDKTVFSLYTMKVDVNNLTENQVTCITWSQLYSQLLSMIGIKNNIIDMGHCFVEFYVDGQRWQADGTYGHYTDLSRVKNEDETVGFGLCYYKNSDKNTPIIVFNEEVQKIINQIDQKLGYSVDRVQNLLQLKDYLDDIKSFSHNCEITDENELCFKLEILFAKIGKLKLGFYEQKDFVYYLEGMLLSEEEKRQIGAVELKKTNDDMSIDIVQCIYAPCGNKYSYYLLAPNMKILNYDAMQIVKLAMMGYGIEDNDKIPGIIYPKRFRRGEVSKNYGYKLYNFLNNMKLLPIEPIFNNLEEANKQK